jgi:hypothetical protein
MISVGLVKNSVDLHGIHGEVVHDGHLNVFQLLVTKHRATKKAGIERISQPF